MRMSPEAFRGWKNRCITLLGMSGVGKTYLSTLMREHDWFHYSGDYRIGTRYLDEAILDLIKEEAMQIPFLRNLLRNDWIDIHNNIKIDNLGPVLAYVGKLGNPELGGVPLDEFQSRQACYREGEIAAMNDLPAFIHKAREIYDYPHLINDVGGSLCELEEPSVIDLLADNSLILYIKVTNDEEEQKLIARAQSAPKPLYYRPEFLDKQLTVYLEENNLEYAAQMDPDDFTRWVFPRLFRSRVPRYEAIAEQYGYTVSSEEVAAVRNENDFMDLVSTAIERSGKD
ncbi:ATPase [Solemya velum gill symbiont]|uniref:ATPase n=2 Tax=Solemya velum gill symbiont TaxID=2340 RepID=A0A1T2FIN7_SOVGS|nr:ATPase [Solemya velum gill symbiont]OOY36218.1 ATPase [Solemya velum gill symbiont]OOY39214.1 ATPase [Solemya velum gill symbiont]OOY42874.1 ATPase [Solemya velum gill symbiont]OOY42968.1 ATPase [Solemya velum gill symbiont]OOY47958.1 ATPase [Solemya velum gill symbiont]